MDDRELRRLTSREAMRMTERLRAWSRGGFASGFLAMAGFAAVDWRSPGEPPVDLPSSGVASRLFENFGVCDLSPTEVRRSLTLLSELHPIERACVDRRHRLERLGQAAGLAACVGMMSAAAAFSAAGSDLLAMSSAAAFAGLVLASSLKVAAGR